MATPIDDEDVELVSRGQIEKQKLRDKLLKKKKEKITVFFEEFRGFFKSSTSNRRDEMRMLYNELDQTLTNQDKELLIKEWKPETPPLILVSSISQLQDMCRHLCKLDLIKVNFGTHQMPSSEPIMTAYATGSSNYQHDLNVDDNLAPNSQHTIGSFNGAFSNDHVTYISRSTMDVNNSPDVPCDRYCAETTEVCSDNGHAFTNDHIEFISILTIDDNNSSDISEDYLDNELKQNTPPVPKEVLTNGNGLSVSSRNVTNGSVTAKSLFLQLSNIIQNKCDFLHQFLEAKTRHGQELCEAAMSYQDKETEPLLFQLVLNLDQYKPSLDMLRENGLLRLNQMNVWNISIFSFLLMKNDAALYQFLKYTKENGLREKVRLICANDGRFKNLLNQKKQEMNDRSTESRQRVLSILKFCT